jgi:4'-phosphopantetheinyl transferase
VRPIPDLERVAASFFSPVERADLFSLPAAQHAQAFYSCWTRKEAYIKAESSGLHLPLDSFDVTLLPSDPVRLRRIADDSQPDRRWSLVDVPISGTFRAAAVLDAPITSLSCWLVSQ